MKRSNQFGGRRHSGWLAVWIVTLGSLLGACAVNPIETVGSTNGGVLSGFGTSSESTATAPGAVHTAPGATVLYSFSISGRVSGLFPGDTVPLMLTVKNPATYAITVTSISTTVVKATRHCPVSSVTITPFSGALRVNAHQQATTTVEVTMTHTTGNVCQKAQFQFQYVGLAKAAG